MKTKTYQTYLVQDIAVYIVNYCNEKNQPISNRKLQLFLYFVQGSFYREFDHPCFEEDFECWKYGPTISKEYSYYSIYSQSIFEFIPTITDVTTYKSFKFRNKKEESVVQQVVDELLQYSNGQLIDKVYEERAFRKNYRAYQQIVIPKEDIRKDFRK